MANNTLDKAIATVPKFGDRISLFTKKLRLAQYADASIYDYRLNHDFARDKGLRTGMTAILHTWGSNLFYHPHIHCIVPGGGIDKFGVASSQ